MNGIDDDKYYSKGPLWKQAKYNHNKKSHEALKKLNGTLHVVSRSGWQLDYETPNELCQYYCTTKGKCFNKGTSVH